MTKCHNTNADAQDVQSLADFVLYSQRSCILRLSPELTKGKVSFPQFFLLAYLDEEECLSMSNIAKMMGHSTAAQTLDYIGITGEEIEEAYRKLNLGSATCNYLIDSDVIEEATAG